MAEDNSTGYFNPRYKAQSTSQLLSPDAVSVKFMSSTSSTSSLAMPNTAKTHLTSFLKMTLPHRKSPTARPAEDRFVMTIIKSPSPHSQRVSSNSSNDIPTTPSSIASIAMNDDLANNSKMFKSKVTAAFNHMKYRKY